MNEAGYAENQNVAIEYRWAEGQYDRLPALAADLVVRQVTVIVAGGGEPAALAAKAATSTIPIVFTVDGDPVKTGLVTSLSRPGGNITGQVSFAGALGAKRLGLVLDLVRTSLIAVLVNPNFPAGLNELADLKAASEVRGQQLLVLRATNESEIEAAFTNIVEQRPGAVIVCADVFFVARREMIVSLAARYAMPAIYVQREYPQSGWLDQLWNQLCRSVSPAWRLHRPGSQRCKTCRPSGVAADQVRASDQPEDRQGAWPRQCRRRCSPAPTR